MLCDSAHPISARLDTLHEKECSVQLAISPGKAIWELKPLPAVFLKWNLAGSQCGVQSIFRILPKPQKLAKSRPLKISPSKGKVFGGF